MCEAFAKSPAFARLSDSHQRKAGAITEFFARYAYEYLGLSPASGTAAPLWNAARRFCPECRPRFLTLRRLRRC